MDPDHHHKMASDMTNIVHSNKRRSNKMMSRQLLIARRLMQYSLEWKKMDITEKMEGCDALEQLILVQLFKANLTKPQ